MAEVIEVEYKANVDKLQASLKEAKKSIVDTEEAAVKAGKKTEESFDGVSKKTESLKTQYRKLKAELANATDPKDIERLARATGELKDKLDDATNAAKVFASESKFEQVGNAVGSLAGKIRNLDFKGAADDAKLLASAIGSITFKDALSGLKDLGKALVDVGASIVTNPLFLIGATVAIVGNEVYKLVDAFLDLGKASKAAGEALDASNKALLTYADRTKMANIQIRESIGAITKKQADQLRAEVKNNAELIQLRERYFNDLLNLGKEYELNVKKGQSRVDISGVYDADELVRRKNFNMEAIRITTQFQKEQSILFSTFKQEKAAASVKATADELAAFKEKEQKKIDELNKSKRKQLEIDGMDSVSAYDISEQEKQRVKDLADYKEKTLQKNNQKIAADYKDSLDRMDAYNKEYLANFLEKKKAEQLVHQQSISTIRSTISDLYTISNNRRQQDLNDIQTKSDEENKVIDDKLKRGIISQTQYDKKKAELEKKRNAEETRIKLKIWKADRDAAITQAAIDTALAIQKAATAAKPPYNYVLMALAAAQGATQIAAIKSQPVPKFAKGGVDINGKGTATSDEIPALISKGESVITAAATKQHKELLIAMNKGYGDRYIKEYYIAPIIKAHVKKIEEESDKSFARNIANSVTLKQRMDDRNLLDSLKASRQNDREIAKYLANVFKDSQHNKRSW